MPVSPRKKAAKVPAPARNYDRTAAERQARRRAQFRRMQEALERILTDAKSLRDARTMARLGLSREAPED